MSLSLPEPTYFGNDVFAYTADHMQDYGQACREAALEEAAKYVENFLKHGSSIAKEIRSLK